jgi:hypothetical protein
MKAKGKKDEFIPIPDGVVWFSFHQWPQPLQVQTLNPLPGIARNLHSPYNFLKIKPLTIEQKPYPWG